MPQPGARLFQCITVKVLPSSLLDSPLPPLLWNDAISTPSPFLHAKFLRQYGCEGCWSKVFLYHKFWETTISRNPIPDWACTVAMVITPALLDCIYSDVTQPYRRVVAPFSSTPFFPFTFPLFCRFFASWKCDFTTKLKDFMHREASLSGCFFHFLFGKLRLRDLMAH